MTDQEYKDLCEAVSKLRDPEPRKHKNSGIQYDYFCQKCDVKLAGKDADLEKASKPCTVPDPYTIPIKPGTKEYREAMGLVLEMIQGLRDTIGLVKVQKAFQLTQGRNPVDYVYWMFFEATPTDLFRIVVEARRVEKK